MLEERHENAPIRAGTNAIKNCNYKAVLQISFDTFTSVARYLFYVQTRLYLWDDDLVHSPVNTEKCVLSMPVDPGLGKSGL